MRKARAKDDGARQRATAEQRRERRQKLSRRDVGGEVFPSGVGGLDQGDFLFAQPALDLFLARDGSTNVPESLVVNEARDIVLLGESFDQLEPVLDDSAVERTGHAGVKNSRLTGEDVNEAAFHADTTPCATSFRAPPCPEQRGRVASRLA